MISWIVCINWNDLFSENPKAYLNFENIQEGWHKPADWKEVEYLPVGWQAPPTGQAVVPEGWNPERADLTVPDGWKETTEEGPSDGDDQGRVQWMWTLYL